MRIYYDKFWGAVIIITASIILWGLILGLILGCSSATTWKVVEYERSK